MRIKNNQTKCTCTSRVRFLQEKYYEITENLSGLSDRLNSVTQFLRQFRYQEQIKSIGSYLAKTKNSEVQKSFTSYSNGEDQQKCFDGVIENKQINESRDSLLLDDSQGFNTDLIQEIKVLTNANMNEHRKQQCTAKFGIKNQTLQPEFRFDIESKISKDKQSNGVKLSTKKSDTIQGQLKIIDKFYGKDAELAKLQTMIQQSLKQIDRKVQKFEQKVAKIDNLKGFIDKQTKIIEYLVNNDQKIKNLNAQDSHDTKQKSAQNLKDKQRQRMHGVNQKVAKCYISNQQNNILMHKIHSTNMIKTQNR